MNNNTDTLKTLTWEEAFSGLCYDLEYLTETMFKDPKLVFKAGWTAAHEVDAVRIRERWISTEERLPTDKKTVIVAYDTGYVAAAWYSPYEADKDRRWRAPNTSNPMTIGNITHWQPLPEAPTQ